MWTTQGSWAGFSLVNHSLAPDGVSKGGETSLPTPLKLPSGLYSQCMSRLTSCVHSRYLFDLTDIVNLHASQPWDVQLAAPVRVQLDIQFLLGILGKQISEEEAKEGEMGVS